MTIVDNFDLYPQTRSTDSRNNKVEKATGALRKWSVKQEVEEVDDKRVMLRQIRLAQIAEQTKKSFASSFGRRTSRRSSCDRSLKGASSKTSCRSTRSRGQLADPPATLEIIHDEDDPMEIIEESPV